MKRIIGISILAVLLVAAGLVIFNTIMGKKPTLQTAGQAPNSAEWKGTEQRILTDCKKSLKLATRATRFSYASKLIAALNDNIKYDDTYQMFAPPEGVNFEVRDLTQDDKASSCIVAWVGTATESGSIAYESATGDIKTLTVQDYPTPTPTETPPVPSPTRDI